jgi:hypothetical protein
MQLRIDSLTGEREHHADLQRLLDLDDETVATVERERAIASIIKDVALPFLTDVALDRALQLLSAKEACNRHSPQERAGRNFSRQLCKAESQFSGR